MKNLLLEVLPVVAALGSALMAGLFFAFSTTVMKTLGRGVPHPQGIMAMQSINRTIVNPVFLLVFVGTLVVSVVTAIGGLVWWSERGAVAVFVGSLLYLGSFVMTATVHIPWNNALDAVDPNSAGSADHWNGYVKKWTIWNHVRGLMCLGAVLAFMLSRG